MRVHVQDMILLINSVILNEKAFSDLPIQFIIF